MLIISFLPILWLSIHAVDCQIHRFGPSSGFMCHCKNNEQCDDTTGECSSGCASFWYGPGCQYRDKSEGEFSGHSDNLDPPQYAKLANDGDPETCSSTAEANSVAKKTKPFWRVWLPTTDRISELMILTKVENLDHFKGFKVYVENVTEDQREKNNHIPPDRQTCYSHVGDAPPKNETIKVLCENPVVGNQVRIELEALRSQLVLCDVKINGGRNLAFGRNISQAEAQGISYQAASNAVDGQDKQSDWTECSFIGDVKDPWLKLDMERSTLIWFIRILAYRYRDYQEALHLQLDTHTTNIVNETTYLNVEWKSYISLNTVARYVTITKPGERKRLQICELKVFGDCLEDECGFDCSKTCHCKNTNIWDKMDGKCTRGCAEGWAGESCDQCDDGKYRQNCSFICSGHCKDGDVCKKTDGHCERGCERGYTGSKCDQKCQSGRYGDNCGSTCPQNCNDGICDNVDGKCLRGCKPGYMGGKCEQECRSGRYGDNCGSTCPQNCKTGVCDNVDGKCLRGCKPGYFGEKCEHDCQKGKFGDNCGSTCPQNCKAGVCDNVDGKCMRRCEPGYLGEKCEQECQSGRYGHHCGSTCPQNCNDGFCDNVDGTCHRGCKSGYMGGKCDQDCGFGKYGRNCTERCSDNCRYGRCNNVDGKCVQGCKPGYSDGKCEQKCDKGMYGDRCTDTCGYCLAGAPCDHEKGACLDGCAAGYQGQLCKLKCSDGHWGPNCISVCGHCANSSACSIYIGTCPDACKPGWQQPLCIYADSQAENDEQVHSIGITVGPTVAVVATGVAVIVTLSVLKRRKSRNPETPVEANVGTSAQDVNQYETIDSKRVNEQHETQYTELQIYENAERKVVTGP